MRIAKFCFLVVGLNIAFLAGPLTLSIRSDLLAVVIPIVGVTMGLYGSWD